MKTKSRSYAFDGHGPDDIAQEIRIICWKALRKFDPELHPPDKWKNFFGRCVDNGLKNFKRDNYMRTTSPYKKAFELLEIDDKSPEAEKVRRLYANFKDRIQRKRKIMHPASFAVIGDVVKSHNSQIEIEVRDLEDHLLTKASNKDIHESLSLLLIGKDSLVTRKQKRKVQEFIKKTLG